jgi:hypothetical protein
MGSREFQEALFRATELFKIRPLYTVIAGADGLCNHS